MRKAIAMLLAAIVSASLLAGCRSSSQSSSQDTATAQAGAETNSATDTQSGSPIKETPESSSETTNKTGGNASYTIGIGQFAEHDSLDNRREGFLASLAKSDIRGGEGLTTLYENFQADGGTASQIATSFADKEVDLMCGIVTPMAQAEYGMAKKSSTPVIFTAVIDPVAAELASANGTPMGGITGTSDKLLMEQQLKMVRAILPDAKKIGIMYTTSKVSSESTIAEYKELAPNCGFETVDTGVPSSTDISLAADVLINKVDYIINLTDNAVVASLPMILDKVATKDIPILGSEIEQVKIGCLAVMRPGYIELGRQTGKMAARVLKDKRKANELNYETTKETAFYDNIKMAENLGITLPGDLTTGVTEFFSEVTQQI